MDKQNFKLYSKYYDLLYQDKNYNTEADYVDQIIKRYRPNCNYILELGSGTGKHAILMSEKSYHVLGLERSHEMVELANQKNNNFVKFKVADITDFQLDQKFDTAISLFHVISYLTDNKSLLQTFNNVNQHLHKDGIFIFDVWHSPAVYHQVPEKRSKKLSDSTIEVIRNANPTIYSEENMVEVAYEITITDLLSNTHSFFKENHPMRHFSKPEIELLAYATGFDLLLTEEFETKNTPSIDTWGVCYVLRKIN